MSIYRKVALERLSSPEQLDQLMQVTRPRGWLALIALASLLAAALAWAVYGTVPTEAPGEGILIRRGGVSELVAAAGGQVAEVRAAVGEVIAKGQTVATIRQEGLLRQIADADARRAALDDEYRDLERYAAEQRRLSAASQVQERANLERAIATSEQQLALLDERIAVEKDLLADGLITQQTLLASEQERNAVRDQLAAKRLELGGLAGRSLEADQAIVRQLDDRRRALREVELELAELRASLRENINVVAAETGRVIELMVDRGDVVAPGDPILSMEVVAEELMAVLFVPAALGKQVQPGMPARVVPSTARREEHGYMVGEVTWVAEFPSTRRGMQRLLANEELVTRLMEEGPPIQVDVRLVRDPQTVTGYRWSSAAGPDLEISSGTLTGGSVIIRRDRPLALLFPKLGR